MTSTRLSLIALSLVASGCGRDALGPAASAPIPVRADAPATVLAPARAPVSAAAREARLRELRAKSAALVRQLEEGQAFFDSVLTITRALPVQHRADSLRAIMARLRASGHPVAVRTLGI